jgi:hypothetical protein
LTPYRPIFVLAEIAGELVQLLAFKHRHKSQICGHNTDMYFKNGGFAGVSRLNPLINNQPRLGGTQARRTQENRVRARALDLF